MWSFGAVPLQGGNPSSRYNWLLNADNRAADWYFESIGYASATPGELGDSFVSASRASGAQPMLTIPMLPYVAKLGPGRAKLASFSIAKYGPQTGSDWQWFSDAGVGVQGGGAGGGEGGCTHYGQVWPSDRIRLAVVL